MNLNDLPENTIRIRLASARNGQIDNPYPPEMLVGPPEPAAVLIPFLVQKGCWHVLFIRRTENSGDRHGGQVAFPGGRADSSDSNAEATALREAQEEIGLEPPEVRILGRLNDVLTISNYRVTPVIGVIPWPYDLHLAQEEVSRAFTIPLAWLANPKNRSVQARFLPPPFSRSIDVIYFERFEGELLWGASARITVNLLSAIFS